MIIIKLLLIVALCYIIAKGLASEAEREVIKANARERDINNLYKEYYQKTGAEKVVLLATIKELREEITLLKKEIKR
jgi:hypothetical protein